MAEIESRIDSQAPEFGANAEAMRALVEDLGGQLKQVRTGGGEEARLKHLKRGKMLPRDRVFSQYRIIEKCLAGGHGQQAFNLFEKRRRVGQRRESSFSRRSQIGRQLNESI